MVWDSRPLQIVDSHVHMGSVEQEEALLAMREATGIDQMALMAIQNPAGGSGLPEALYMKHKHPERFFVFAGLNHAGQRSEGQVIGPSIAQQVDRFVAMGCDGIKMIEGKPTSRQVMDIPVTDPYFADYWARVEKLGLPVVWHVNDPEEFWDPNKIPGWAKERNWGYGPQDAQSEQLYAEVDEVLARHRGLRIVFAHFYFLSADLGRAGRLLDEHPGVHLDLAPGIEMLYNISRDPDAGREFFIKYADRILFGTDLYPGLTLPEAQARAGIVFRWLQSEDTFRVPAQADFLLGQPEDGVIRGMALPDQVLNHIYLSNFRRLVGETPKALDVALAAEECRRLAAVSQAMGGKPADQTQAALVAGRLA